MRRALTMILTIAVLLTGCSNLGGKLGGEKLAEVNGKVIVKKDLATRLKIYELFFRQPVDSTASRQQVLDQMVRDWLIAEQAESVGVAVTDEQVEGEMARFFGALDRQYTTREEVNKRLQELGLTNDMIAAFLKEYLLNQGIVQKKKADVAVTDEELRTYYEQNKATLYTFKEHVVRASHVLIPADQEAKAREVAAKAKAGGDFAELARLYSVDPGTAQNGGDLGYFTRGTMLQEFADAAFSQEVGKPGDPVQSTFGWHVILVAARQGPGVLAYEQARDDCRNRLLPEKQEKAYQQWVASLEKSASIRKANLAEGA